MTDLLDRLTPFSALRTAEAESATRLGFGNNLTPSTVVLAQDGLGPAPRRISPSISSRELLLDGRHLAPDGWLL